MPYRSTKEPRKLRIGYYEHDNFFKTSNPILRGLRRAREILEQAGVEIVPFDSAMMPDCVKGYAKIMFGADMASDFLGDEAVLQEYGPLGLV